MSSVELWDIRRSAAQQLAFGEGCADLFPPGATWLSRVRPRLLWRREALQLVEPVQHDVDLGGRLGFVDHLDHQEPLTVG
jgi:hypothetical protein